MILSLEPVLRDYAWGSTTSIQQLIGRPSDGEPLAELWLGAHPSAPAQVQDGATPEPLDEWLRANPAELGERVVHHFGLRLPYLLKVLAADKALSLQVHPSSARAAEGFSEEEASQVALDDPTRRYRDPFHKPEMVIAVTEFHALCGLRPVDEIMQLFGELGLRAPAADYLFDLLLATRSSKASSTQSDGNLAAAFEFLLSGDPAIDELVTEVVARARGRVDADPIGSHADAYTTVVKLSQQYPGDAGIVVSLLLNQVTLAPGEALYLKAGNVHAYLSGTAIEVMATSDNVIRAGLTPKHVDVPELLSVVEFEPLPLPYVIPRGERQLVRYRPGADEFQVDWVEADDEAVILTASGPRILLCLGGEFEVSSATSSASLAQGNAVFIGAVESDLKLNGTGAAVLVSVPA